MAKKLKNQAIDLERKVIDDPVFRDFVKQVVREILDARSSRPVPKQGFHYKRDWSDKMDDKNEMSSDFFLANINDIWLKKSNLSSDSRSVIKEVCGVALGKTLEHYHKPVEEKVE